MEKEGKYDIQQVFRDCNLAIKMGNRTIQPAFSTKSITYPFSGGKNCYIAIFRRDYGQGESHNKITYIKPSIRKMYLLQLIENILTSCTSDFSNISLSSLISRFIYKIDNYVITKRRAIKKYGNFQGKKYLNYLLNYDSAYLHN